MEICKLFWYNCNTFRICPTFNFSIEGKDYYWQTTVEVSVNEIFFYRGVTHFNKWHVIETLAVIHIDWIGSDAVAMVVSGTLKAVVIGWNDVDSDDDTVAAETLYGRAAVRDDTTNQWFNSTFKATCETHRNFTADCVSNYVLFFRKTFPFMEFLSVCKIFLFPIIFLILTTILTNSFVQSDMNFRSNFSAFLTSF